MSTAWWDKGVAHLDSLGRYWVYVCVLTHRALAQHEPYVYCDECPWPRLPPPARARARRECVS